MIDFDSFDVHFPEQVEVFGHVYAGETTAYRKVARAHRYACTEAFSGERKFLLQPIDFVGENYLKPGIYTYRYDADPREPPAAPGEQATIVFMSVALGKD